MADELLSREDISNTSKREIRTKVLGELPIRGNWGVPKRRG